MAFRTLQPNGLLLYQAVADGGEEGEENEGGADVGERREGGTEHSRLLDSFHLFVELRQGHLRVGHMFDHYKDILNLGRGEYVCSLHATGKSKRNNTHVLKTC